MKGSGYTKLPGKSEHCVCVCVCVCLGVRVGGVAKVANRGGTCEKEQEGSIKGDWNGLYHDCRAGCITDCQKS